MAVYPHQLTSEEKQLKKRYARLQEKVDTGPYCRHACIINLYTHFNCGSAEKVASESSGKALHIIHVYLQASTERYRPPDDQLWIYGVCNTPASLSTGKHLSLSLSAEAVNPKDAKEVAKRLLESGVSSIHHRVSGEVTDAVLPPVETDHQDQTHS